MIRTDGADAGADGDLLLEELRQLDCFKTEGTEDVNGSLIVRQTRAGHATREGAQTGGLAHDKSYHGPYCTRTAKFAATRCRNYGAQALCMLPHDRYNKATALDRGTGSTRPIAPRRRPTPLPPKDRHRTSP